MKRYGKINQLTNAERMYILKMYQISAPVYKNISTNKIAKLLEVKASSATDMLKRLASKGLILHIKYHGCEITNEGIHIASILSEQLVLTKQFLSTKLDMNFEDSQDIAEKIIMLDAPILFERIKQFQNLQSNNTEQL